MKAVLVKWVGPTNVKAARYKVWANNVKPHFYQRSIFTMEEAVKDFCGKYGWGGKYVQGTIDNNTDVFVPVLKSFTIIVK